MKSIQTKFILVITVGLLLLAVLVGGFSIWNTNRVVDENSVTVINSVCTEQALRLDTQLQLIEQAVNTVYCYADHQLTSIEELSDSEFLENYVHSVEDLMVDVGNQTDGTLAIYFRIAPELVDYTEVGFFWTATKRGEALKAVPITHLLDFEPDDMEHVGWYYVPIQAGKAIWMTPYYNENIGAEMISYVIPFYRDGVTVGLVGMDIDFSVFVDMAQSAALYDNGRANLIDMESHTIYYREPNEAQNIVHVAPIADSLYENLARWESNGSGLQNYVNNDIYYKMAFQTLRNGMKFVLYAPVTEIDARRNELIMGVMLLTIGVLVVFIVFTSFQAARIIRPLKELNYATSKFAKGEWDVQIECKTNDEVKTLTDSILKMASHLQEYIAEINKMAYQDALTGVKNKTYYMNYVDQLNMQMKDEGLEYGIVVFDVNGLKQINDSMGHEFGDKLILAASHYICEVFTHSPVFRVGGDEFVAILKGTDYDNRTELLEKFENGMEKSWVDDNTLISFSVAFGLAEYPKDATTYDQVFNLADEKMYTKKRQMKATNK